MVAMTEQAIPRIEIRPMRFNFEGLVGKDPVWSQSCPFFAVFINALAIHAPYFERFLGVVSRKAKAAIHDQRLVEQVAALIGQEAQHAYNFVGMNKVLVQRYPKVLQYDRAARAYFETALRTESFKRQLGFVAGYETFTYLAGMIVLDRYDEFMGQADPTIRALYVWHQVEEVEHGSVAFDMYRELFGKDEWFRKWMVIRAFSFITWQTVVTYIHMCRVEGYLRQPLKTLRAVGFFLWLSQRFVRSAAPALLAKYHPSQHPRCKREPNPIAVAWRRVYAQGGDVSVLDDEKMQHLRAGQQG